jgi:predicted house-cleaning NTP pyrophosphatase (Maf/HAM1 superfamily)
MLTWIVRFDSIEGKYSNVSGLPIVVRHYRTGYSH